jgi:hypothetical protein
LKPQPKIILLSNDSLLVDKDTFGPVGGGTEIYSTVGSGSVQDKGLDLLITELMEIGLIPVEHDDLNQITGRTLPETQASGAMRRSAFQFLITFTTMESNGMTWRAITGNLLCARVVKKGCVRWFT